MKTTIEIVLAIIAGFCYYEFLKIRLFLTH